MQHEFFYISLDADNGINIYQCSLTKHCSTVGVQTYLSKGKHMRRGDCFYRPGEGTYQMVRVEGQKGIEFFAPKRGNF